MLLFQPLISDLITLDQPSREETRWSFSCYVSVFCMQFHWCLYISSVVLFVFSVLVEYSYPMHLWLNIHWYYSTLAGYSYQIQIIPSVLQLARVLSYNFLKPIYLPTVCNMSYVFTVFKLHIGWVNFLLIKHTLLGHFYTFDMSVRD